MPTPLAKPWPSGPVVISTPGVTWTRSRSGWPGVSEPHWRKLLELVEREVVAAEVQHGVEQHRAVAGAKDEAVAVRPRRVGGVVLHDPREEQVGRRAPSPSAAPGARSSPPGRRPWTACGWCRCEAVDVGGGHGRVVSRAGRLRNVEPARATARRRTAARRRAARGKRTVRRLGVDEVVDVGLELGEDVVGLALGELLGAHRLVELAFCEATIASSSPWTSLFCALATSASDWPLRSLARSGLVRPRYLAAAAVSGAEGRPASAGPARRARGSAGSRWRCRRCAT